jgi:DNA-binding transcriptional LysR family regulator
VTPSGLLRIAGPLTFCASHLAPATSDYMTRYPSVRVEISLSDRHVNLINEGFDLAIRIGEPPDSALIARPAYLDRASRPEKPVDLGSHACLIYTDLRSPRTWRFPAADGRVVLSRHAAH